MRARYCSTSSRDVTARRASAARISGMLASTTLRGLRTDPWAWASVEPMGSKNIPRISHFWARIDPPDRRWSNLSALGADAKLTPLGMGPPASTSRPPPFGVALTCPHLGKGFLVGLHSRGLL